MAAVDTCRFAADILELALVVAGQASIRPLAEVNDLSTKGGPAK